MSEQTFIIYTETPEQESALKAFVKSLKVKFEIFKEKPISLSKEQKIAIDEAITSIETKGTIEHHTLMEETKKRFPHLFNR
ncbi:MAG: hypothetical protein COZ75_07835 [Flavobacteriaceae bacterium CG_4_8_14_3_um_filter_34_10]|nr:MAG: hypothetical protein COZ75_07835 [Flavobacteriaceae bacterium CG_4_8_14_3_um_filter_34_10]